MGNLKWNLQTVRQFMQKDHPTLELLGVTYKLKRTRVTMNSDLGEPVVTQTDEPHSVVLFASVQEPHMKVRLPIADDVPVTQKEWDIRFYGTVERVNRFLQRYRWAENGWAVRYPHGEPGLAAQKPG